MIPLINYDFQWGRSEVVLIYPDIQICLSYIYITNHYEPLLTTIN